MTEDMQQDAISEATKAIDSYNILNHKKFPYRYKENEGGTVKPQNLIIILL